ncbi:MAG: hypothetical protein WD382_07440 [Halofilum sp. (in: g-proteobacteria)]
MAEHKKCGCENNQADRREGGGQPEPERMSVHGEDQAAPACCGSEAAEPTCCNDVPAESSSSSSASEAAAATCCEPEPVATTCCGGAPSAEEQAKAAESAGTARFTFQVQGLDCAEELAILKREVGPVVGGEDRLSFDPMNGRMMVLPEAADVSPARDGQDGRRAAQ